MTVVEQETWVLWYKGFSDLSEKKINAWYTELSYEERHTIRTLASTPLTKELEKTIEILNYLPSLKLGVNNDSSRV